MLAAIGMQSEEDLIAYLPTDVRFDKPLNLRDGQSEYDIIEYFKECAARNANGNEGLACHAAVYQFQGAVYALYDVAIHVGCAIGIQATCRSGR